MADSNLTIRIDADASSATSAFSALNNALGYTTNQLNNTKNPIGELFSTLQSSSDSAIAGLIKGTENWQKAFFNVIQSIEIRFAQLVANKLLSWVESELGMTAATQAGNVDRTASDTAGAATSSAARVAQSTATLMSDAALTFGGVYANLAPVLGPAAAAPAAASEAQVLSQLSLVSLDVGAWNVPQDMPANLHAGEMVVPANFASGLRAGNLGGGGGDNYTINISAIDTQTGAQFLKNNASSIASVLSSQVRNFNRNLPAWKS